MVTCQNCGRKFKRKHSDIKAGVKHQFCCVKCKNRWVRGENHHLALPKEIRHCIMCGAEFETAPQGGHNFKKMFCSGVCRNRWLNLHRVRRCPTCPTQPERRLIEMLKENKLPFNYVGNGSLCVDGLNPDFVNDEQKKIIEVFGDYWHEKSEIEPRRRRLAKAGYETLIIWEHEINKEPQEVTQKILTFMEG